MHPILARGRRLGLYLLVFAQTGLVLAEVIARTMDVTRVRAVALVLPLVLVHAFTCLASWYLCRRQPLTIARVQPLVVSHAAAALVGAALAVLVGAGWATVLEGWPAFEGSATVLAASRTLVAVFAVALYSLVAAVHYLFIAVEDHRQAEGRAYRLRLEAREAELRALRAQVDPHFLFNSLNSINALVGTAPERARVMCRQLADFLRTTLERGGRELIAIEEEVALAECYLEIERVRFGARLTIATEIEPACVGWPVPALLLQPLVENAVTHGIAHCLEGGHVEIRVARHEGLLSIRVENPCDPDRPQRPRGSSAGIGLANVKQRLRTRYGRRATIKIDARARSFTVSMQVPRLDDEAALRALAQAPDVGLTPSVVASD